MLVEVSLNIVQQINIRPAEPASGISGFMLSSRKSSQLVNKEVKNNIVFICSTQCSCVGAIQVVMNRLVNRRFYHLRCIQCNKGICSFAEFNQWVIFILIGQMPE